LRPGDPHKHARTLVFETINHAAPMSDQENIRRKLDQLKLEHRDLDDVIARVSGVPPIDEMQIRRLKKRKLVLKDQIAQLESGLLPDIIA
jgi:hypothetical protein